MLEMSTRSDATWFDKWTQLSPDERMEVAASRTHADFDPWHYLVWLKSIHRHQWPPQGEWNTWLILGGRGAGKTRAGAEWVSEMARGHPGARIALVGGTPVEVERVMIRGESGLIAVARTGEEVGWHPSRGLVRFSGGAEAFVYSGANPDSLRGPQHHFAWCDELAKWAYPQATWDNLKLGLRLGERPRALVTTTPRPIALLRALVGAPDTVITRGRMQDNLNLADAFSAEMLARYGGTRFGRQELDGELIEDVEGALWTRDAIERGRARAPEVLKRVVIGVDPPASAAGTCGILACGMGTDGITYVLGDASAGGLGPDGWARAVARAAECWSADLVVAESNQGGEMVASVLKGADCALPVKAVQARFGKGQRAEPIANLFAQGKAKFAGAFPELEDQLCGLTSGGGYEGPGRSPDRADAMVWAMIELTQGRERAEPRIRRL